MTMATTSMRNKGFGLLEILVTLGVLGVGIAGVTSLHGVISRQGQDNQARIEASAMAVSRIEELRHDSSRALEQAAFELMYPDTAGFAHGVTSQGLNAVFTRSERIVTAARRKQLSVQVAWTSASGAAESLSVSSELAFVSPRSSAAAAFRAAPQAVLAPAGRAQRDGRSLPEDALFLPNGDGTSLSRDGDGTLLLVSEGEVVLGLPGACQGVDGSCRDFSTISGRVWIDTATQSLPPGQILVVASGAAFCTRYYSLGSSVHQVTAYTLSALATPGGDYQYFDYTCYVGGGWHGNVGILPAGGLTPQDKVCMGDPAATDPRQQPVLAMRRSYRGMLYKHDAAEDDGRQKLAGSELVRYYSQGLADETTLPATGDVGHDFVIARMPSAVHDDAACLSRAIMLRADAVLDAIPGGIFAGMPTDFVCLNEGLLDVYDEELFGHDRSCAYDPTDPAAPPILPP